MQLHDPEGHNIDPDAERGEGLAKLLDPLTALESLCRIRFAAHPPVHDRDHEVLPLPPRFVAPSIREGMVDDDKEPIVKSASYRIVVIGPEPHTDDNPDLLHQVVDILSRTAADRSLGADQGIERGGELIPRHG